MRLQLNLHIIYIFILFVQFAYNVHVPCVTWFKPGNCKAPLFWPKYFRWFLTGEKGRGKRQRLLPAKTFLNHPLRPAPSDQNIKKEKLLSGISMCAVRYYRAQDKLIIINNLIQKNSYKYRKSSQKHFEINKEKSIKIFAKFNKKTFLLTELANVPDNLKILANVTCWITLSRCYVFNKFIR